MSDLSQRLAALSPEKRALLEMQLQKKGREYNTFPLSYAQQRLWLLDQLQPGNTSYNMPMVFHVSGVLDVAALQQSLNTLLERHEALRTTFAVVRGKPMQVIAPPTPIVLTPIDLSNSVPPAELEATAQHLIDQEGQNIFDLARGPLVRFTLIRVGPTAHILIVNLHHICADGWSLAVFTRELATLYAAFSAGLPSPLPPLSLQYADYAVWQREQAQSAEQERQVAYWLERLRDAPAILELPTDYARPSLQTFRGGYLTIDLSAPLIANLQALSRQVNATLFMTLLAIFQTLLFRQTGQADVVVGTPIANRNRAELEEMIGFFVNTLAMRTDLSGDPTFREVLSRTRDAALGAYSYQDVSFDRLLEDLNPVRDLSHSPIFQVLFNMVNTPEMAHHWGNLSIDIAIPEEIGSKFDLTLYVEESAAGAKLELLYNADLFKPERMQEVLAQYAHLAAQVAAMPDQRLSQLSLLTPTARAVLPDPTMPLSDHWEGAVHHLFAQIAAQTPQKLAVKDSTDSWSYAELEARSNQLAQYLHTHGIVAGSVVAIYAHRDASLVWAILGIFKAGATYTILDPAYPIARLQEYMRQARPQGLVALTEAGALPEELRAALVAQTAQPCIITLPGLRHARSTSLLGEYSTTAPDVLIGPDDIASITFTSGSTGRPKGILQRHGPLTHFLPWQQATFGLQADDRYIMLSGLSHDPLQRDIFTPLCLGATICVPDPNEIGAPGWLAQWLAHEGITITNLTPAMLQLVTQQLPGTDPISLSTLRCAFTVGDALKRHDVARLWAMAPNVTCVNMYGSTETQRAVSFHVIPRDTAENTYLPAKEVIPLGRGLRDMQVLVLTPTKALAGIGELGELAMRSPHLAQGYLDETTLTHERFVPNPFTQQPSDRIYLTGDLGRYLPDGDVEYLARSDQQVQIRGFRIELGEIEAVLRDQALVRDVAVIAREDTRNEKRLVAYVVPTQAPLVIEEVRQAVQKKLPMYMVPTAFVILDALPLTPNGKLDRQRLPQPDTAAPAEERSAPRTPLEATLEQIWREVLGREYVGIDANFFDLGGHSLLATQLVARIIESTHSGVTLRMLFEAPTIASLAAVIERLHQSGATAQRPDLLPLKRITRKLSPTPMKDDATQPPEEERK